MARRWKVSTVRARGFDVKDYASALEYLTYADGDIAAERARGTTTNIEALTEERTGIRAFGLRHHSTLIVAWYEDGRTYVRVWDSVTSKQRISAASPAHLYKPGYNITCRDIPNAFDVYPSADQAGNALPPVQGTCEQCARFGIGTHVLVSKNDLCHFGRNAREDGFDWERDANGNYARVPIPRVFAPITRTRPKDWKCRACSGSGKRTDRRYVDANGNTVYRWNRTGSRLVTQTSFEDMCTDCARRCTVPETEPNARNVTCSENHYHYRWNAEPITPEHHSHGTGVFRSHPCGRCDGTGRVDYGSRPIPVRANHGALLIFDPAGNFAHYAEREPFRAYTPPPKPLRVRKVTGEIIAYRGWSLGKGNAGLLPLGVCVPNAYDSFNLPNATCANGIDHAAPAQACHCGYWSMQNPAALPEASVYGRVRLWGDVIRHTDGFRSSNMSVDYLVVPATGPAAEDIARIVARRYPDVPVYAAQWPLTQPVEDLTPISGTPPREED